MTFTDIAMSQGRMKIAEATNADPVELKFAKRSINSCLKS